MELTDFLCEEDLEAALAKVKEPESFRCNVFFPTAGFNRLTPDQICQVFTLFDRNKSGSLGSADLTLFLKKIKENARPLTDNEVQDMMKRYGEPKNENMIGPSGFQAMAKSSKPQNQ